MKATAMVLLTFLLVMSGCEGCRRESAPTGSAPTGIGSEAAPQQPAAAAPAAPQAGAPQKAAPAAGQPDSAAQPLAEEDDCIVIADANPDYGPPPLAVSLSAEAECTHGQPTYKWDFGDGGTASEANPSHTYAKAGDFTAVVTVTAGSATATDEIDITVEEDAEPETP